MTLRAHQPTGIRVGGRRQQPPVLGILLAISLAANAWFLVRWAPEQEAEAPPEPAAEAEAPAVEAAPAAAAATAAVSAPPPAEPAAAATPAPGAPRIGHITINGAVSTGFVEALGEEGERVGITASRLLVWNLDLTKDPRKGDTVDVQYRLSETGEADITIDALRYKSSKFGRSYEAYRYQPEGWAVPSWFDADGAEVPARLKASPIEDYLEVTSLIGDGRGHAGMDFKAPVGTPVFAPFAGTVTRVNWNWKYNGNCLEMKRPDGSLIRFLHLSGVVDGIQAGTKVTAGQTIAKSGNTGRSSAPHLHYELKSSGGRTLDPLKVHGVTRRTLPAGSKTDFAAHVTAQQAKWAATDAG